MNLSIHSDTAALVRDTEAAMFYAAALWGACLALSGTSPSPDALRWLSVSCAELEERTGGKDAEADGDTVRDIVLEEIVNVLKQAPQYRRIETALAYVDEELRVCREYRTGRDAAEIAHDRETRGA